MHRLLLALLLVGLLSAQAAVLDITSAGAKPGDPQPVTAAIQGALDRLSAEGGGTVVIPSGVFIAGPLQLRSHVALRLERGAVLRATDNPADYRQSRGFVSGNDITDSGIEGEGTLDGNGHIFEQRDSAPGRPHLVDFRHCRDTTVRDVTLRNGGSWTCRFQDCDGVRVHGVQIHSHQGYNNDGFDIDSRNVVLSDCVIDCDDDAICLKSDSPTPCENVSITNCVAASNCNLIKMGTSSVGGFKNISISNCVLHAASEDHRRQWKKRMEGVALDTTGISGIAIECVDGGAVDQIVVSNIAMTGVQTPIFLRLGNRRNPTGSLRNVIISGITATTESLLPSSITGLPGHEVENVVLRDIQIAALGHGTAAHAAKPVPEKEKSYPENRMFGDSLPAYGLYVRHAHGITLENVRVTLRAPDARPALVLDDAHDVALRNFRADPPSGGAPLLALTKSAGVAVSGFRTPKPLPVFVQLDDANPKVLSLIGNDFDGVEQVTRMAAKTP